jgi:8-oxo-dGTP pyrophosphatase MutT (NUDIX family)
MELCDVVDKFGNRTGRIVERGTKLTPNEFYLVVHVWIRDDDNNYLIQQRALDLDSDPGIWAATVGYVMSGEESIDGAIREVEEELGISLSPIQLKQLDRHAFDSRIEDIWMAEVPRNSIETPVPGEEVENYKWVSRAELDQLVNQGEVFRYSYHGKIF